LHLAAQHGHGQVLEVMRSYQSLRISSKKLGVTALHVAAYFGQAGAYIFSGKVDHLERVLYYLLILSKNSEKNICEHSGRWQEICVCILNLKEVF